jgi:sugar phosphate isomerase/epimerase
MPLAEPQSAVAATEEGKPFPARIFPRTELGLVAFCFGIQARLRGVAGAPDLSEPAGFIREAARLGARAVQINYGILSPEKTRGIRDLAERLQIALEATLALPKGADSDLRRFEAEMQTLRELGVKVARTVLLPGRRYEQFKTILEYANALQIGLKSLSDGEKIARRTGVRLALENHKDQTLEERLALLEQFSSEWIGACLDVGNNMALIEDPLQVARAFAPWTLTVHFKDQGIREYDQGFLLADVPLGEGAIDLPAIIKIIREKKPDVGLHLELITRDPLEIPFLRNDYWATLNELKAPQLGAALALLKSRSSANPFPIVSRLSPPEQVKMEQHNIELSFRHAADQLGLRR